MDIKGNLEISSYRIFAQFLSNWKLKRPSTHQSINHSIKSNNKVLFIELIKLIIDFPILKSFVLALIIN